MSKTIKEVYDDDQTNRNDPSLEGLIPGDDGNDGPVVYHIDQLAAAVQFRTDQPLQDDLIVTIPENTLTANIIPVSGITYTHWIITVDDATQPIYPTNFLPAPHALTKDVAAWGTSEVWRLWLYDLPSQTLRAEITAPDGTSGVTVVTNATAPPVKITDFSVPSGTVTATTAPATFTATTIVDSTPLTYDIINNDTSVVINGDVTPGSITITGLSPATTYNLAVNVYPTSNVNDTTTRASISNVETITTSAIGTITGFVVDDVSDTGGPGDANISTFTVSDGGSAIDEGFVKVDDGSTPASNDTGWDTIANWLINGIDVVSYGAHTVYAWARDASFPTSLTARASNTMTATDTTPGTTIVGFDDSTLTTYEERAETVTVTVNRSGDTTGVSTIKVTSSAGPGPSPASVGVNYQGVDQVMSFSASDTTATCGIQLLWSNLGFNTASVTLTLSDPTGATLDPQQTTIDITIEGTNGRWSLPGSAIGTRDGDIDLFNPPFLPAYTGSTTLTGGTETIEFVTIDAAGANNALVIANTAENKTIENCIIKNAFRRAVKIVNDVTDVTIRNCLFENNGNDGSMLPWEGQDIHMTGVSGGDPQRINILGNRFYNSNNGLMIEYGTMDAIHVNWNYKKNQGANALRNNGTGKLHRLLATQSVTFTDYQFNGNIVYMPDMYEESGFQGDCINTYRSGNDSGSPGSIRFNVLNANCQPSFPNQNSGLAIIIGDDSVGGYWECMYNTCIESGQTGVGIAGGTNQTVKYNDLYMNFDFPYKDPHGSGLYAWRIPDGQPGQAVPGTFKNAEIGYNRYLWYNSTSQNNIPPWKDTVGSDGLRPNHGPTAGGAEQNIVGWDSPQTNIDMTSDWGNDAGDALVKDRRTILNQPAYDDGIYVMYASHNSAVGNGRLTFTNGSPDTLTWKEYNDSSGSAVDLTAPVLTGDERFELFSGNGSSITVHVTSADLPGSNSEWTVNVTQFKLYEIAPYVGVTGAWVGVSPDTPDVDVTPPTIPTNGAAASASSTSLDLTWYQSTDAGGMGGYYVYRDITLIATLPGDPGSPAYTDTGSDLPAGGLTEDQVYSYQVSAYDTAANVSEKSEWFSGTPTAGTNLITNGEFVDTSGWTERSNTTFEVNSGSNGVARTTNTVSSASGISTTNTITVVANTQYTLTLAHNGQWDESTLSRGGRYVVHSSNNNTWYTNMASGGEGNFGGDTVMTEHVVNFTTDTGQTTIYLILWVNSVTPSGWTEWDYVRLEAT